MVIGVVSDTHLFADEAGSNRVELLYDMLKPHFHNVEAVLHSGDLVDLSVVETLKQFGDVFAVSGNMDPSSVKSSLPEKRIVKLDGFRIGMIHGWGASNDLPQKVRQKFAGENVDCIVFGHSHHPYDRIEDGVLLFNPGSPTDKRYASSRNIGILHLEDRIWGEHISLD